MSASVLACQRLGLSQKITWTIQEMMSPNLFNQYHIYSISGTELNNLPVEKVESCEDQTLLVKMVLDAVSNTGWKSLMRLNVDKASKTIDVMGSWREDKVIDMVSNIPSYIKWCPDANRPVLALSLGDWIGRLVNVETSKITKLMGIRELVKQMFWVESKNSIKVCTVKCSSNKLHICTWDGDTLNRTTTAISPARRSNWNASISRNGTAVFVYYGGKPTIVYPDHTTRVIQAFETGQPVAALYFSGGTKDLFLCVDRVGTTEIWNTRTGKQLAIYPNTCNVYVSQDGTAFVFYDYERKQTIVVDFNTLTEIAAVSGCGQMAVAQTPRGGYIAMSQTNNILVYNMAGILVRTLKEHTAFITSLDFSPDGTMLASGSKDGTVRIWNVAECQVTFT